MLRSVLTCLCCVLLMVGELGAQLRPKLAAPAPLDWRARGIGGGGALFSVSLSPNDPDLVYMATDMTSVFRSADLGRHWNMVPFQSLTGGIDTQVRFTGSPEVLYSVSLGLFDERIAVRSGDGGASFQPLPGDPAPGETFYLQADPGSTQRLLLSSWDRLYFSNDGGVSFSLVHDASADGSGFVLAGALFDGARIFVGSNQGLLVSQDGGLSWSVDGTPGIPAGKAMVGFTGARSGAQVRLFALAFPRTDVWGGILPWDLFGGRARLYALDWGAGGWTKVFDGAGSEHPVFVAMAQNDRDTVYLAGGDQSTGDPMVLKSTDGGASWQSVLQTGGNQNVRTGWMGAGGDLEWYWAELALGFGVAPGDANRVVVTDFGFVHSTRDGGLNWSQAYVRPADENPAGAPTPNGRSYGSAGADPTSAWWIEWLSPAVQVVGFSDIRGIRSTDGGRTYAAGSSLGLPHNSTYHLVTHPSGSLYAATSSVHDIYQSTHLTDGALDSGSGRLVFSGDGGASFQTVHGFGHPVVWLAIDPGDSETLYASVVHRNQGGIYVTHNLTGGASFARLSAPPRTQGHPFNIHVLADGALVSSWSGRRNSSGAFTTSSGVFYSSDGGASWQDRSHVDMRRWTKDLVIDPHDPTQDTWYAAVFSHWGAAPNEVGGIFRTIDRGLTWTRISDSYRVESLRVDPLDPDRAWFTTETEGLWVTENLTNPVPDFTQDARYPFRHPLRVFPNPHDPREVWCTAFGGGVRVTRR